MLVSIFRSEQPHMKQWINAVCRVFATAATCNHAVPQAQKTKPKLSKKAKLLVGAGLGTSSQRHAAPATLAAVFAANHRSRLPGALVLALLALMDQCGAGANCPSQNGPLSNKAEIPPGWSPASVLSAGGGGPVFRVCEKHPKREG